MVGVVGSSPIVPTTAKSLVNDLIHFTPNARPVRQSRSKTASFLVFEPPDLAYACRPRLKRLRPRAKATRISLGDMFQIDVQLRAWPNTSPRFHKLRRFISGKPYSVWSACQSVYCYWNTSCWDVHRRAAQDGLARLIASRRKRQIFATRGVCRPMILLVQMVS